MKTTMLKGKRTFILAILLLGFIVGSFLTIFSEQYTNLENLDEFNTDSESSLSLPTPDYGWWNTSWTFRIPVEIKAIGNQQDAPVECFINFTKYFKDLNVQNPKLNITSIRVIEYLTSSNYFELDCQFDPYTRSYNAQTNAIGDLIWILNGTTNHNQIRDFYVYFNNGSNPIVPDPNYDLIRLWHEGFEEYQSGDILRPSDGQDRDPDSWEISNTTSARGQSSLRIWGNCWKVSATGTINIGTDTVVTAKMRFDDPTIAREISGIGFRTGYTSIPASQNGYNIRGSQNWGSAGSYKFRNQYYAANTFFWYTFNLDSEISATSFDHIFYVADDDSYNMVDLYWDDISIWAKIVQTTPNNSLETTLGDIQPLSFTLKITCKDEDGNLVPNAHIFLSNNSNPTLNQDHVSDEDGEWTFLDLEGDGKYNITINYTQNGLSNPKTKTVFLFEGYTLPFLNNEFIAYLNLTKFNFNVTDLDSDPIQNGFVILINGTDTVGKTVLSDSGTGSVTWINGTSYDYEAYFDYDSLPDNSRYIYSNLSIYSGSLIGPKDIDVPTNITKIIFNVTDDTPEKVPFTNAKLRFYNTTDYDNENKIIANVTVDIDGIARFTCLSNRTKNWGNYTVDLYFGGGERDFIVNPPSTPEHEYNFTLVKETQVSIEVPLIMDLYNSTTSIIDITSNPIWSDNVNILVEFIKQDPLEPNPIRVTPDELFIQILDEELTGYSQKIDILSSEISEGLFDYTFNTKSFNLIGGNVYYVEIIGDYKSYMFKTKPPSRITIQPRSTNITYYDYTLNELTEKRISVSYSELVNITVDYYDIDTGDSLDGALITYDWDYGFGTLDSDPIHTGLYYFTFDASLSPNVAEYIIDISASLTNFSTIMDSIIIRILPRLTTINGTTELMQISPKLWVSEAINFTFEYRDTLRGERVSGLETASYTWFRLDENGNPLTGEGNEGSGDLIETNNNLYVLDFDTETRVVGEYSIFVSLQKNNHEIRHAYLTLTIRKRLINASLDITSLTGDRINIVQGDTIEFRITLTDPTNQDQFLTGATVILTIRGINYTLTPVGNDTGEYVYTFSTKNINAFILPNTIRGALTFKKENYETKTVNLIIVVGMTEIFPGMPMFYFLLIVGGIVAVVGSLATYRFVQQARIPTFVKKARKMKKEIKGKKAISESLLYPSKEEYLVNKLSDHWETLGLSLRDVLGVEITKKKTMPEVKEEVKFKEPTGGEE